MTAADGSETSPGAPSSDGLAQPRQRLLVLAAAALVVELVYVFYVSAGSFSHWHYYIAYLNDLADGFRQGHLHLSVEPPAALLARPNPLDGSNLGLWYWDASLYHGHYYLYWGPVPALLLAVVKTLFRISAVVGDEPVVFALATLQLVAGTLFIERAGRRLFDRPPLVLEVAAVFVFGLANPTLYNLGRAAVYEAAIVGGHAFLLLGLVFAFDAVWATNGKRRALVAAGACWSTAMGCRISLAPAVALLALVTMLGFAAGRPQRLRRAASAALWIGLPLALGFFTLLAYNRLRFGEWLEFGRKYQLTFIDGTTDKRFIRPNIYAYLRRPPVLSCRFPFAYALQNVGERAFPPGYVLPPGYFVYEQVVGVLRGFPWSWFAPIALLAAARAVWRKRGISPSTWAVAATAIAASVGIVPGMMLPSATNRYLGDVAGGMALLSALGLFGATQALQARPLRRRLVVAAALLLAVPSVGIGLALGIKGQYAHFEQNNPPLYQKLVRRLSVCRGEIPPEPK